MSGNYPLLTHFPFTKLSSDEILDLFRSYCIILGETEENRTLILKSLQTSSRESFINSLNQMIEKSIENSYDTVTV
jgi:hypothetical protein